MPRIRQLAQAAVPATSVAGRKGDGDTSLAWLLGVPVPILVLVYLLRGCS